MASNARSSNTMRAARIHDYGDVESIRIEDVPIPSPDPDDVLLEVSGYSFNPGEVNLRAGRLLEVFQLAFPFTLGHDVSGTVVEVGSNVTAFDGGDNVIGRLDGGGAAAEYVAAPAGVLVAAPERIPLADASAMPVAGLTAWQAVVEHGQVSAGDRVLVNGAGGGVGYFAIQLAKDAGAYVIATASSRSRDRVLRLGADQVVDYTKTSVTEAMDGLVDVLLNLIPLQGAALSGLGRVVRTDGAIVSITEQIPVQSGSRIRSSQMNARNDVTHLKAMADMVDEGRLIVEPNEHLRLDDLLDVHRRSELGETSGKLVLIP